MEKVISKAFAYVDSHKEEIVSLWEEMVNTETGLECKKGLDEMADRLKALFEAEGATVEIKTNLKSGRGIVATFGADRPGEPIIFLGHYDTVFKYGTVTERPFTIKDGKAFGPGVLDMKGGVVTAFYAVKALNQAGFSDRPIKIVLAGDEEIGHIHSNMVEVFQQEAKGCKAAFNFETGDVNNSLIVGRKGNIKAEMEVKGVAVHAGREPENGRSAILEIAHKVIAIQDLTDFQEGTTYNVGVIEGGTVSNAVPDYAKITIDVRYLDESITDRIISQLKEIAERTYVEGTSSTVSFIGSGGVLYKPMEKTEGNMKLFEHVRNISQELGFNEPPIEPVVSGGASDSPYSVLAGVPTIDQFGVKGKWNHSPREYAVLDSIFERIKLAVASVVKIDEAEI